MSIFVWRYTLEPRAVLNAVSGAGAVEGALLRIGEGYACLQPWPELGDDPLEDQLRGILTGQESALVAAARQCAASDGAARCEGRSLFDRPVPDSHWLARPGDQPDEAWTAGFRAVKFKIGPRWQLDLADWAKAGFRLRLDANESHDLAGFLAFWDSLGSVRDQVEFVEDPVPWSEEAWEHLRRERVPLAADRDVVHRHRLGDWAVIKPASTDWLPPAPDRFVVTSSMDHALGQLWAACRAMEWFESDGARLSECGLLTHRCFEADSFFEQLSTEGPRLVPPPGTGLGFDDLLAALPWKRLT